MLIIYLIFTLFQKREKYYKENRSRIVPMNINSSSQQSNMSTVVITSWPHAMKYVFSNQHEDMIPMLGFIDKIWHQTIYISILYYISIFSIKNYMANRASFSLRTPLALWSLSLAVFSAIGTYKTWPYLFQTLLNRGTVATYCDNSYIHDARVSFWYTMFVFSKPFELIDTIFIVMRKQSLIQLHWVHHILTMVYCFFVYRDGVSTATWMVCMNFAVHTVMYGYYALKAMRVNVPRKIAFAITVAQIVQMIWGLIFNFHVFAMKIGIAEDRDCNCSFRAAAAGAALYSLFFYYFVEFFIGAYFRKRVKHSAEKADIASPAADKAVANNSANDMNNNATPNRKNIVHDKAD